MNSLKLRLSFMMFLQYFIWGSWYVTMGTYLLQTRKFEGGQVGSAYGVFAIAAMISPFFVGMIADRFFATERIMVVLHLTGGVLVWLAAEQTHFEPFFWLLLAFQLCYVPTLALTNSLSFHHLAEVARDFPRIKIWGSFGWIVAGCLISYLLKAEDKAIQFKIASLSSFAMAFYSLTLPHTPPKNRGARVTVRDVLGLDALKLLKSFPFSVFLVCSFLNCIPLNFYYVLANSYFNESGMAHAGTKMTLGQVSDMVFLALMPFFLGRYGIKRMLLIGMAAWVTRYFLLAYGNNGPLVWMFYGAILVHGICYDFFFVTGHMYVDQQANEKIRGAAQGLIAFVTFGLGTYVGARLAGETLQRYSVTAVTGAVTHDWKPIWILPAIGAGAVMLVFALMFRDDGTGRPVKAAAIEAPGSGSGHE